MSSGDATIVVNDKAVVNINGVVNYDGSSLLGQLLVTKVMELKQMMVELLILLMNL